MRLIRRVMRVLPWIVGAIIAWTEYRERTRERAVAPVPAPAVRGGSGPRENAGPREPAPRPMSVAPPAAPAAPEAPPPPTGDGSSAATQDAEPSPAGDVDSGDEDATESVEDETSGGLSSYEAAVYGLDADQSFATDADEEPAADESATAPPAGEPARLFATDAGETAPSGGKAGAGVPPGAVAGDGTATCPDDHPVKGNASSLIYHLPGMASYERTIPEYCFDSAAAAEAAGFRAPRR